MFHPSGGSSHIIPPSSLVPSPPPPLPPSPLCSIKTRLFRVDRDIKAEQHGVK